MTLRDQLERLEDQALAPYAMRSMNSRGREHEESEHDFRTAYQRDRERIIHTTAFRRLKNKTQVFVATEGDHYRTRLTHTMEVAQVGRALARMLRVNEDLAESVCLAHDLGHPPFGHSGEEVINELMADYGGFNHNDQSLRVVDWLERRYEGFHGLNLSWELREGIVKHETDYDYSDATEFEPSWRATIEAQIVNFADEFAYSAADLDDGLRSGILTPEKLTGVALWDELVEGKPTGAAIPDIQRHTLVRQLINVMVTDLVESTRARIEMHGIDSIEAARKAPENLASPSDGMRGKIKELKGFLFHDFYYDHRVRRMASKARRLLTDIFGAYIQEPKQLPPDVLVRAEEQGVERTICDYVAGMTDQFALDEHAKLFDPNIRV